MVAGRNTEGKSDKGPSAHLVHHSLAVLPGLHYDAARLSITLLFTMQQTLALIPFGQQFADICLIADVLL